MGQARAVAAGLGLLCALGCAHGTNYLEHDAPVYSGVAPAPSQAPAALRVVTFNIEMGRRFERAASGLRAHEKLGHADLVLLQEMNADATRWIAEALGMSWVYYPASREKDGRDLGEAILSRWPIEESAKLLLPHTTRIAGRAHAAVRARIRVGDRALRVYSVHLGAPLGMSGKDRREEALTVLADAETSGDPVIVAGDFNSKSIGELFVKRGYAWPTRDIGHTVMMFSFDHVFARGFGPGAEAGVARELSDASDHRPVWVTLLP
jgi:endonuclease/exonuclease/phosphatase family metal-dependent hydrolase